MLFVSIFSFSTKAQDLPQPSPSAALSQTVGLTKVSIDYSRPGVKGRAIFGDLVPYGKMWRTGANKATKVEFSTDVKISGKEIKAGAYSLFTIPNKDNWEVIINNNTELWGTGGYKQEEDVVRFTATPKATEFTESMLFTVQNVSDSKATVELSWDKTKISFDIEVSVKETAMANIDKAIKDAKNEFRTYNNSARYYIDNNIEPTKALDWAKKSVEMTKKFWNVKTLSEAYALNGDYKMAIKTAEESLKLSEEAKYDPYIKMNKENIEKWKSMK